MAAKRTTVPVSYRIKPEVKRLIAALAHRYSETQAGVIAMAVEKLARETK